MGVISEPEIIEHTLNCEDLIMVLGSDGLFEFLTNDEIIKIVSPYYSTNDVERACEELL